jgi:hypothetical protein
MKAPAAVYAGAFIFFQLNPAYTNPPADTSHT